MYKEFDELIQFAVVRGGTLKNNRKFGEMVAMFRATIVDADRSVKKLVDVCNNGDYHLPEDCKAEGRKDCEMCKCTEAALNEFEQ